jgi:hypothetical protein
MATGAARVGEDLSGFACPNPECIHFNQYDAANLRVGERNGKGRRLRRLVCCDSRTRFQDRKGALMEGTKIRTRSVYYPSAPPPALLRGSARNIGSRAAGRDDPAGGRSARRLAAG